MSLAVQVPPQSVVHEKLMICAFPLRGVTLTVRANVLPGKTHSGVEVSTVKSGAGTTFRFAAAEVWVP